MSSGYPHFTQHGDYGWRSGGRSGKKDRKDLNIIGNGEKYYYDNEEEERIAYAKAKRARDLEESRLRKRGYK